MQDKVNYALVGAFTLGLGAALIAAILWLVSGAEGKTRYLTYQSIMKESVSGLNIDAPVKLLGVTIGKVSEIIIDPKNSSQVRLRLSIEQGTPIKIDTEAVLKSQGLTGIAYVELTGGTASAPSLVPTANNLIPSIVSKASLSTRLETVLNTVLTNVDLLSENLNAVFDSKNRAALAQILADSAVVTQMLASQKTVLTKTLGDAQITAQNTALATAQLKPTIERITAAVAGFDTMTRSATRASQSAEKGIASASITIDQISGDTLPSMNDLLANLNQLVSSLNRLSEQTARNPNSVILGAPKALLGPGEKVSQ